MSVPWYGKGYPTLMLSLMLSSTQKCLVGRGHVIVLRRVSPHEAVITRDFRKYDGNILQHTLTYIANGPGNKSLNFIFPTKYRIPKSLKG